jgi:hypothetical protein
VPGPCERARHVLRADGLLDVDGVLAGQALEAAVAAGANVVHSISFEKEDATAERARALEAAMADARTKGEALARLIESLARSGSAETLERIKPYLSSSDPRVADAARFAVREITRRLDGRADN